MGQVGRWIDTLGERERDAIIMHPDPTYLGEAWWDDWRDCGCLVGCVVDAAPGRYQFALGSYWRGAPNFSSELTGWTAVGVRFPFLTKRFTPERMWRVVKARAARNHAPSLTTADVPAPALSSTPQHHAVDV